MNILFKCNRYLCKDSLDDSKIGNDDTTDIISFYGNDDTDTTVLTSIDNGLPYRQAMKYNTLEASIEFDITYNVGESDTPSSNDSKHLQCYRNKNIIVYTISDFYIDLEKFYKNESRRELIPCNKECSNRNSKNSRNTYSKSKMKKKNDINHSDNGGSSCDNTVVNDEDLDDDKTNSSLFSRFISKLIKR